MKGIYINKNRTVGILVDEDRDIIKSFGMNLLCCDPEATIELEELEEVKGEDFEWTYVARDIHYIKEKYNLNIKQISKRFGIPYRTVQNWNAGARVCPLYVIEMMDEILTDNKNSQEK